MLTSGAIVLNGQVISSFGAKTGISLANQSYQFTSIDYTMETRSLTSPTLALFLEAFRGQHMSFQVDVAYVVKGNKTSTRSVTVNHLENEQIIANEGDLVTSKFRSIEVSPLVRYRMEQERLTPYILLGPRIDFLINYETGSDYPLEDFNKTIIGLSGGAGAEFGIGPVGLFLEVQYHPDLSPVTNKVPLLVNNNVLLFTFGIRY